MNLYGGLEVMLLKRLSLIFTFSLFVITNVHADNSEIIAEVHKVLKQELAPIKADVHRLKIDSTPESIHNFADAIRDGIKVEHSIKVPYSAIFGFTACLSIYSLWRGVSNYWNAHKTKQSENEKAANEVKKNKESAQYQICTSIAALAVSAFGLWLKS